MLKLLSILNRISRILADVSLGAAFLAISTMAVIGALDAVMTNLFTRAFTGALELSSACLAASSYLGLPYAQRFSRHITVDVITARLPVRWRKACTFLGLLCMSVFLAILFTRMWELVAASLEINERDSGPLAFPVYPFKMFALFGVFAASLEAFRQLFELILKGKMPEQQKAEG